MRNKLLDGICGWLLGGNVIGCINHIPIVGNNHQIGGIIGATEGGKIINCTNLRRY